MKHLYFLLTAILWIVCSMPTSAQVSLVKDIVPGGASAFNSNSKPGIAFGDMLIFPAWSEEFGNELWISDGTSSGTLLLKDINEGVEDSDPHSFFWAFGKIYFNAFSENFGRELWVTDGTSDGTFQVMDIQPGGDGSDPIPGDIFHGYLYFAATSDGDREAWRVDSLSSPQLFMNTNTAVQGKPREFKSANGLLYFSANIAPIEFGSIDQDEPFISDGTEFGTLHLDLPTEGPAGANVSEFEPLKDYVFFFGSEMGGDFPTDLGLYYTSGDIFSTGFLNPFINNPPFWLMPVNGKLNFCDEVSLYVVEVEGFDINVKSIAHVTNPQRKEDEKPLAYINGNLCIPAEDLEQNLGVEVYVSNGDSVWLVKDIYTGGGSSDPWYLVSDGAKALFAASSSETNRELYESDGTNEGTRLVTDLYPGEEGSNPIHLVIAGKNVFFYATTPETGYELYKYELEPSLISHPSTIVFDGKVFPQPAHIGQTVNVSWKKDSNWEKAELTQSNGMVLRRFDISGGYQLSINTENLAPGVHYLNLVGNGNRAVCKMIVQ